MNDTSIEARLERALHEVADRLPERDLHPPRPVPHAAAHNRRRPVLSAAAAVVMAMSLGGYLLTRDRHTGVQVGTGVSRPLLTASVDGYEVHLHTAGEDCVVVVVPGGSPSSEPACGTSGPIALKAINWAGSTRVSTLVWGVADRGTSFAAAIEDGATSTLHEERLGRGAAFLLVIDVPAASGTVDVLDHSGRVIGRGSFDHGGPARQPKGTLGDQELDFAYRRDGAIWVRTKAGEDIRITDGTETAPDGYPIALPDGRTVMHSYVRFDSFVDGVRAVDARLGRVREVPSLSMLAVSPNGQVLASSAVNDDSGATEEIVLLHAETFAETRRISIGVGDSVGSIWDAVWDADGKGLVVVTRWCCSSEAAHTPENHLWFVDVDGGSAVKLTGANGPWILANRAVGHHRFPALRHAGSHLEWGTLRLEGTTVRFEHIATLSAQSGIDMDGRHYLSAHGDRTWLVGDGRRLFDLTASGTVQLLLEDVDSASAP